MNESILQKLRSATSAAHARLEERVQIGQRVQSIAGYRELLEKFLGWYEPLEHRLAAVVGWREFGMDLPARSKVAWLENDLRALGLSCQAIAAAPRCADLPRVDSLARGFGCAYVMEGATLGGRHISAMLHESAIPGEARTFFGSYGDAVGDRWKEFIASLEKFSARRGGAADILDAAVEAFSSMEGWVTDESPVFG